MPRNYQAVAARAVFAGRAIPSHDQTHDLAGEIAEKVKEFHTYVASVRDEDQADEAVAELLTALSGGTIGEIWRTLGPEGRTTAHDSRATCARAAQAEADATGETIGVEQYQNGDWWLTEIRKPSV